MTASRGLLVVVSGPSGVGKDTVLSHLFPLDPNLTYSVSYTTRAPRAAEVDGRDYTFVDDQEFDRMIRDDELLEWALVHGHRSGTGRHRIERARAEGKDVVLNIDVQGGASIRELVPDALLIFLTPPSLEELTRRRAARGTESADELAQRAKDAEIEMQQAGNYDAVVVNDDPERAAAEVRDLISARRRR